MQQQLPEWSSLNMSKPTQGTQAPYRIYNDAHIDAQYKNIAPPWYGRRVHRNNTVGIQSKTN